MSQTILPIGILPVLYTSFMPKLTVFCMILKMFPVLSNQSCYLLIVLIYYIMAPNYGNIAVLMYSFFYVAWRKTIRRIWKLINTTHCSLLPSINDCISIDIVLEQRCAKFIWSYLISCNAIIKITALSAISSCGSTFGDNYRYLSYKYNIGSHVWMQSLNKVIKCISLYVSTLENLLHSAYFTIMRDLCLARDNYYQSTPIVMLIECLCTT